MQYLKIVYACVFAALMVAGCETMPVDSDTEGPNIIVTENGAAGVIDATDPGLGRTRCPDGSTPRGGVVASANFDRIHPVRGASDDMNPVPINFSVAATDGGGVKEISIQMDDGSTVTNITPSAARYSDDEEFTAPSGTRYFSDFIRLDVSGETPLTAQSVGFSYLPRKQKIIVVATDFNDNQTLLMFAFDEADEVCGS